MFEVLSNDELTRLAKYDSPTVCNAIECFDLQPRTAGYLGPSIARRTPGNKPMVGYAATAKYSTSTAPTAEQSELFFSFLEHIADTPGPSIAVQQDIDDSIYGAFWGEVNVSTVKTLGCVGIVTDGAIRDLEQIAPLNVACYSSAVCVSHAYMHIKEVGGPIDVDGTSVLPGDLLHGDNNGIVIIPNEIAPHVSDMCDHILEAEEYLLSRCRESNGRGATIEEIRAWRSEMARLREKGFEHIDQSRVATPE